jgi:Major Facilitator Superfamily
VALPSIDADLAFSSGDLQWVLSAYLLSFGGLLLLGGRAADLLGRRRMFILGTGLFAVASLGAGLAGTAATLLTARAVQGVAAAIMTPTALSILMTTFPEGGERNKALGIWGSTGAIGGTAAWLVGGPVTDGLGWEWIFLINVPVAVGVVALSPLLLGESRGAVGARRFDVAGATTITAALVALVYAVVEAPQAGWGDGQTLGLLALAAILLAVFAGIESRSVAPLAPLEVFRSRSLVGGNLVLFTLGTMAFAVPFILTQYAQEVLGWSAIQFGLASVVMPVTAVIGTSTAQAIATKGAIGKVAVVAMGLTGLGSLVLTQVSVGGSYFGDLFFALVLLGLGVGAAYVAGSIAVADRRGRVRSRSGLGSQHRVVPDRRCGRRRDPLHGRRVGRTRRRPSGTHQRLPVRLHRGDRSRGARGGGGEPAARQAPRARGCRRGPARRRLTRRHQSGPGPFPSSGRGSATAGFQPRLERMAITTSAAQTAMTPGRPVKTAASANRGTEIPIDPSTISF